LRYLEKTFAAPSRKSAQGSLFGVKPKNSNDWSSESCIAFQERATDVKLTATLKGHKKGAFELLMIDENCSKLTDFMVQGNFADVDTKVDCSFNAFLF